MLIYNAYEISVKKQKEYLQEKAERPHAQARVQVTM